MERVKGIEPSSQAWEARILPLNHTRIHDARLTCSRGLRRTQQEICGKRRWRYEPKGEGRDWEIRVTITIRIGIKRRSGIMIIRKNMSD
jgi:hypothetical protein